MKKLIVAFVAALGIIVGIYVDLEPEEEVGPYAKTVLYVATPGSTGYSVGDIIDVRPKVSEDDLSDFEMGIDAAVGTGLRVRPFDVLDMAEAFGDTITPAEALGNSLKAFKAFYKIDDIDAPASVLEK